MYVYLFWGFFNHLIFTFWISVVENSRFMTIKFENLEHTERGMRNSPLKWCSLLSCSISGYRVHTMWPKVTRTRQGSQSVVAVLMAYAVKLAHQNHYLLRGLYRSNSLQIICMLFILIRLASAECPNYPVLQKTYYGCGASSCHVLVLTRIASPPNLRQSDSPRTYPQLVTTICKETSSTSYRMPPSR